MKTYLKPLVVIILALFGMSQVAKSQSENDIVGIWLSEKQDAKIQIFKSTADGKFYGSLIWGARMYEADGKTSKLAKNGKPFKNLLMLQSFVFNDGVWEDGTIYDPEEGKTYSCVIKKKEDALDIRGYVGISLLGRTTVWTKVKT